MTDGPPIKIRQRQWVLWRAINFFSNKSGGANPFQKQCASSLSLTFARAHGVAQKLGPGHCLPALFHRRGKKEI